MIAELQRLLPVGWIITDRLKSGGQGAVFRGSLRGTPAAIKLFGSLDDPRRVQREIDLLKDPLSAHLVRILDNTHATIQGRLTPVVAYELLAGHDLEQYLAPQAQVLSERDLALIGAHVSEALETLWLRRICHRDVKPGNIIKDGRGYVLVDVGIARYLDLTDVTLAGAAPGTRGFMSPEQATGRRTLTVQSDVFSLGVTLFCLAGRRHPFGGMQPVQETRPLALSSLRTDLSEPFANLIHSTMAFVPSDRPRNTSSLFRRFT